MPDITPELDETAQWETLNEPSLEVRLSIPWLAVCMPALWAS